MDSLPDPMLMWPSLMWNGRILMFHALPSRICSFAASIWCLVKSWSLECVDFLHCLHDRAYCLPSNAFGNMKAYLIGCVWSVIGSSTTQSEQQGNSAWDSELIVCLFALSFQCARQVQLKYGKGWPIGWPSRRESVKYNLDRWTWCGIDEDIAVWVIQDTYILLRLAHPHPHPKKNTEKELSKSKSKSTRPKYNFSCDQMEALNPRMDESPFTRRGPNTFPWAWHCHRTIYNLPAFDYLEIN